MTVTPVPLHATAAHATAAPAHDAELQARFAEDVWPLVDVLLRGARRLTRNEADAEDLLQETLVHAYAGFRTFRAGTNLQAWLFRIQHNQWINAYRRRERRPDEVLSDTISDRQLLARALPSAESEVMDLLPDGELRDALAQLSDGFRTVLYYADIEGYTYAETAARMGIPVGTVMSRVFRARTQLRRALRDSGCARDFAGIQSVA